MRSEKKIEIQRQRIADLENRITELEQENSALEKVIEDNKSTLLSRQTFLDEKEKCLDEAQAKFNELLVEVRQIKDDYQNAINDANRLKEEYSKKMAEVIRKAKKHKR